MVISDILFVFTPIASPIQPLVIRVNERRGNITT